MVHAMKTNAERQADYRAKHRTISVQVDNETAEKFDKIAEELGSKKQAIERLIKFYSRFKFLFTLFRY